MTNDSLKVTNKDECPHCGSKEINKEGIAVSSYGRGSKLPESPTGYKCLKCGKYFEKKLS